MKFRPLTSYPNVTAYAILLAFVAIGLGVVTVQGGLVAGILIVVAMVALPAVYGMIAFPVFGIVCIMTMAFLLFFFLRFGINFPMGTVLDGMQGLLLLGFFIRQRKNPDWSIFKGPVATVILLWVGYNLLEVINPWAESRMAWVYSVRTVGILTLTYFIFVYQINSVKSIRIILKVWLGLAFIAAIYGYKQEFIGIADSEMAGLVNDPLSISLLFIDGHWRKYSIFSDPVEFSYNMVITILLCIALIAGPISKRKKIILTVVAMAMLYSILFSGTRSSYVLIPAALILFAILNFRKEIMVFSAIAGFFTLVLIYIPTTNGTLYRFQSAFKPSDDASYNVRKQNQKKIQPYILSHPMGGGLGATGAWGVMFAPNSFLATFPPDSGYMRVAVELGWIGLLVFCCMMYVVLKSGIENFYRIKDPELRMYCLAMTLVLFALNIGNFPQEALTQYPNNILFYLAIAIIQVTYRIDQNQQHDELEKSLKKSGTNATENPV
jgi:putative inorganic carbon (HCO3(-)) transporter